MMLKIRIWDEAASDTFYADEAGRVYDEQQKLITGPGPARYAVSAAWGAIVEGETQETAAQAAIAEWAEGYDGDPSNIRAEVSEM
jgi:hypothetical protein